MAARKGLSILDPIARPRDAVDGLRSLTGDDLARVVDHALVVLVLAVREVHPDCGAHHQHRLDCKRRLRPPMFMPASRSAASFSTEFVFGPAMPSQRSEPSNALQASSAPIVAIIAVWQACPATSANKNATPTRHRTRTLRWYFFSSSTSKAVLRLESHLTREVSAVNWLMVAGRGKVKVGREEQMRRRPKPQWGILDLRH